MTDRFIWIVSVAETFEEHPNLEASEVAKCVYSLFCKISFELLYQVKVKYIQATKSSKI